jgi:type III restriction enzyme
MSYEVSEPILNKPFEKPANYWYIQEGEQPQKRTGRRPALVFPPRDQREEWTETALLRRSKEYPAGYEMALVRLIRERVEAWQAAGFPGVTRTTLDLLSYWRRDGREKRFFYAQWEAAQTIIFLNEARQDFLQGISVPRDEPSDDRKDAGYIGLERADMVRGWLRKAASVMVTLEAALSFGVRSDAQAWSLAGVYSRLPVQRNVAPSG